MWERLGHQPTVAHAGWPVVDEALLVEDSVTASCRSRARSGPAWRSRPDISEADLEAAALADARRAARASTARPVRKVIVRAPKLVNIVVVTSCPDTADQ